MVWTSTDLLSVKDEVTYSRWDVHLAAMYTQCSRCWFDSHTAKRRTGFSYLVFSFS